MTININPFDLEKHLDEDTQKDLVYQQIIGFAKLKETTDMLNRLQNDSPAKDDFILRDVIFAKRYPHGKDYSI